MRHITGSTARAARLLLLLVAVIGLHLQPASNGQAAEPTSPSQVTPAALLAGPPVPVPVSGIEQQGGAGDGRAPSPAHDPFAGEQAGRVSAPGCTEEFCPWRASDALARAGRRSSPSTAPPAPPV